MLWGELELLDERGQEVEFANDTNLQLLHPVLLTPERLEFWRDRAGALSPEASEVLNRPIFISGGEPDLCLSAFATDSFRLERWLRRHGWFHGEPLEQGVVYENCCLLLQRDLMARLIHSGYAIGARDAEPIELLQLEFKTLDGHVVDGDDLPPEVYSELCYALYRLNDQHEP